MEGYEITKGEGRTRVCLSAHYMGSYPIICIYNENAHIGAVALGEYDDKEKRAEIERVAGAGIGSRGGQSLALLKMAARPSTDEHAEPGGDKPDSN